jgi:hypothetical protein
VSVHLPYLFPISHANFYFKILHKSPIPISANDNYSEIIATENPAMSKVCLGTVSKKHQYKWVVMLDCLSSSDGLKNIFPTETYMWFD